MPRQRRGLVRKELQSLSRSLLSIVTSLRRLAPLLVPASGRALPKRKLNLSPKRREFLKLQGQYMGSLRNLKPRQKAEVKALKAAKGYPAAIARAKRLAKRG